MSQSMVSLYFGLFLYAVSTAFVVPCMTTVVSQVHNYVDARLHRLRGVLYDHGGVPGTQLRRR